MTRLRYQDAPSTFPLTSVIQGATRGNPCLDLDVDIVAIEAAAGATTQLDWNTYGVLPAGLTADGDGTLHLTIGAPSTLFSQTADFSVFQQFNDSAGSPGPCIMWLDFFPDANVLGNAPLQLANIDLYLGRNMGAIFFTGTYNIHVTQFDEFWNRQQIIAPIAINAKSVTSFPYTIDFNALGQRIVFYPGQIQTQSGQGLDSSGAPRNLNVQVIAGDPVSQFTTIRGFSIGIETGGAHAWTAPFLGCAATGFAPQFDITKFWRTTTTNRNCGPYTPYRQGAIPGNVNLFPGPGTGDTGAVPILGQSFGGAIAVTNGYWGRSKEIVQGPPGPPGQGGRRQNPSQGWHQPYHNLRVNSYAGWTALQRTGVWVFNLGLIPTQQVEVRIDDAQPVGTSITYTLAGSATGTGGWVSIGTVVDGQQLLPSQFYQYYQLTAVFSPSSAGFATPNLSAFYITSRTVYNTFSYVATEIDSTVTVDPLAGQSEIAEFKLPLHRIGPRDYTDPATTVNTAYAPNNVEAYVYAKNRVSGQRYLLNIFRLENREPSDGLETMTFVSGLDQLQGELPHLVETFAYPLTGSDTITAVTSLGGNSYRLQVATSPWTAQNPNGLVGFFYYGISGANDALIFAITANTGNTVTVSAIDANGNGQPAPQIGDTFQIHSQLFNRPDIAYSGMDYAAIYADILTNQAACPKRFQGQLPVTTGRIGSGTITNDSNQSNADGSVNQTYKTALEYLQDLAVHCGGFVAWRRGRIDFVNFYGPVTAIDAWDDRHLVSITPTVGADRRMPSIHVKYNYNITLQTFQNAATYNDINAVIGWGRSNLFDVFQLPDDVCKWNDASGLEAQFLANMYLGAWSTGARYWQVETAMQYPWLQEGDAISITTDLYTDRLLNFSLDGLTDTGSPIKGRVRALGIIIGKNLWGDRFVLAIRGLSGITAIPGTNTNTGGAYTAIACPAITAPVDAENPLGWQGPVAAVNWTIPASPFYDHMELQIASSGITTANISMGVVPPFRVNLAPNGLYTFTPTVVTKAGVRTVGAGIPVSTLPSDKYGTTFKVHLFSDGSEGTKAVVGTYSVAPGGGTPTSYSTWTGGNPNAVTATTSNVWYTGVTPAVITLVTNPVAITDTYTLTYNLVSARSGTPAGLVRVMIEYNISGAGWNLYGYTPAQAIPYTITGATIPLILSGVEGATSVAFRLTAQAQMGIAVAGNTVTSTVTGTSVAWTYSTAAPITRRGHYVNSEASQPHLTMVPNPTPPTAAQAAPGELTIASLSGGTLAAPQIHDTNAIRTFMPYDEQSLTVNATTSSNVVAASGTPGTNSPLITVTGGEAWAFEIDGVAQGAAGPAAIFVLLWPTNSASFTIADWVDMSSTTAASTIGISNGAIGVNPPSRCSNCTGRIFQRWYVTINHSGTVTIGIASSVNTTTVTLNRGTVLRGKRLS